LLIIITDIKKAITSDQLTSFVVSRISETIPSGLCLHLGEGEESVEGALESTVSISRLRFWVLISITIQIDKQSLLVSSRENKIYMFCLKLGKVRCLAFFFFQKLYIKNILVLDQYILQMML